MAARHTGRRAGDRDTNGRGKNRGGFQRLAKLGIAGHPCVWLVAELDLLGPSNREAGSTKRNSTGSLGFFGTPKSRVT